MNQELQRRCELFVDNKNVLDKKFVWDSAMIMPVCAMLHADLDKKVDVERLTECKTLLKKKVDVFSNFRSYAELVLISKMSFSDNPEGYLEQVIQTYNMIKKCKMSSSVYTVLAAMVVVDNVDDVQRESVIEKAAVIYAQMKKDHPFLTSTEDVSFAILMAMSDMPEEKMMSEMENCYKILKAKFSSANAVQSLSHILAMSEQETVVKCDEVLKLNSRLKEKKKSFDSNAISVLGGLNMIDTDKEKLVAEIIEVDEFLKTQKGFGFWGIGEKQRLLFAASLVMNQYGSGENSAQVTVISSTITAIIVQYTAMLAAVTAATVASSSSN